MERPRPFDPNFIWVTSDCPNCGYTPEEIVFREHTVHHHHRIDPAMLAAILYGGRDFAAVGMPSDARIIAIHGDDVEIAYDGPDQIIEWKWLTPE